jgi:fibronectin-binding autotransporter adhesin
MKPAEQSTFQHGVHRPSLWPTGAMCTLTLAASFLAGPVAHSAQTTNVWVAGTDSYNNPAAWNPASVPNSTNIFADVGNGGTVNYGAGMVNALAGLLLGEAAGSGTFMMSGGELDITNTLGDGKVLILGNTNNSIALFQMDGGTLNVVRKTGTYQQDGFQPGFAAGSDGTFTLNNGTANFMCGIELGINGKGTLNVNGGTLIDDGWFGVGRGGSSAGWGVFNQTGGTVYILRNPSTEGGVNGLAFTQSGTNGTVNISNGSLYTSGIRFAGGSPSKDWETLNIWGGDIYLGGLGVVSNNNSGTHTVAINISGGTFHSVNLLTNAFGTNGLSTIGTGGTNWTWTSAVPMNLSNSPGPGILTLAPEATRTFTLNGPISGTGALRINGPGTVVLGAALAYTGGTTLSQGTLQFNGNGSIADPTLSVPLGSTIVFNSGNAGQAFTNNFTGAGDVLVSGNAYLLGSLSHSGNTVVSAGTLAIGSTLNNSTSVVVTNTGTLAGNGQIGAPVTLASTNSSTSAHLRLGMSPLNIPDTLTINNNLTLGAGSELDIKLGTAMTVGGGANDLLVVNGNLTINSNAFLNLIPLQPLTAGTYVIATYTGTLTGQFTNTVTGLTRYGLAVDYSTPGQIKLNVSGNNASLVWYGMTNNVAATTWDVQGTPNWLSGVTAATFSEGDAVTFDDTATNCNVVLSTLLYPASITFNNVNSNYSLSASGSGRITGGSSITKSGNGTVTMASGAGVGNDFTGPVQINGGIFKLAGGNSLGATNGGTTVASGATLDLAGAQPAFEPLTLQGTGFGGTNGALMNSGGSISGGLRYTTLANDTLFNSPGRFDFGNNGTPGGSFQGNGHAVTKIGSGQLFFKDVGETGLGDITVSQGQLGFQGVITMGDPAKTCTVAGPSGTMRFFSVSNLLNKQLVLTNGTTFDATSGSNNFVGPITLWQTNSILVNNGVQLVLGGVIGGSGGFTKGNVGLLYLNAANTFTGPTLLTGGSLILGPSGSLGNSSAISLAAGTLLDASRAAAGLSLGAGQTLSGSGSVLGEVTARTGATIAPGSALAAATLSLSNSLSLNNNSTNIIKLSADAFTIDNGVNDLILIGSNLVLSGTCYLEIVPIGTLDGANPYTVMQYNTSPNGGGSLSGSGHFTAFCSNPRYTVSVDTSNPGSIQVRISGSAAPLLWKGDVAGSQTSWDLTTANWLDMTSSQRVKFFNGDVANFDDTASTFTANVVGTMTAGSVVMANNAHDYAFTGGQLAAGLLDMEGSRSLTLALTNAPVFSSISANAGTLIFNVQGLAAYTNNAPITDSGSGQSTIIQAGTNTLTLGRDSQNMTATLMVTNGILRYTNANNLGVPAAPLYATGNGTLDMFGVQPGIKNICIAGAGFNGQGALIDSKGLGSGNGLVNLTLVGDAALGAPGVRWDFNAPGANICQLNGNGYKLTKVGTGTIIIYDQYNGDTGLGDIDIVQGRLGFQLNNAAYTVLLGDANKTLTIGSNATLTFFEVANGTMSKQLVLNGISSSPTNGMACFDSAANANPFTNSLVGPVTLNGTNNLFGLRRSLSLPGAISGSGGFVVGPSPVNTGTGTLYLSGANTYTGPTVISNNYAIVVAAGSSLGNSSRIQVNTAANLDVSALSSLTLGPGQTLMGAGTNIGNLVFGNGATLAPGFPSTNTYTLTIKGNLSLLAGCTNLMVVNKTSSLANDTVAGLTTVAMGGNLVINNVGKPLAGGDAIRLFTASSGYTGGFDSILPATPGANLAWDTTTLTSDGTLRVISLGPPSTPTNLVYLVSANQLTLSWPANYVGWLLQAQTNAPGLGLTPTWYDVPGSATTNQVIMPLDATKGSVFYRMILR